MDADPRQERALRQMPVPIHLPAHLQLRIFHRKVQSLPDLNFLVLRFFRAVLWIELILRRTSRIYAKGGLIFRLRRSRHGKLWHGTGGYVFQSVLQFRLPACTAGGNKSSS